MEISNLASLGIITFFIVLIALAGGGICLLVSLITYLTNRKSTNYKYSLKVALWFFLIAGISLLLSAILCSSSY